MRKITVISAACLAVLLNVRVAEAAVISLSQTAGGTQYSTAGAVDLSSVQMSLGDVLSITFTGMPNTLFEVNDAHLGGSIAWASQTLPNPIFSASFVILDYAGNLVSTTLPAPRWYQPTPGCLPEFGGYLAVLIGSKSLSRLLRVARFNCDLWSWI
jgi:hypothetical protein